MKYLLPLLLLLSSNAFAFGTCKSSYYFTIPSNTKALYEQSGATKVVFKQINDQFIILNNIKAVPIFYDTKLVVNLNTCSIAFSSTAIDPVNYKFWLNQNYEVWLDPDTIDCSKNYRFSIYWISTVGNTINILFRVDEII